MSGSLRGSGTRQRGGTGRMVAAVVLLVRSGGSLHRLRPRRVSQALGLRRLFDLLGDTITFQSVTGSEKDEFFRNPEVVSSFYSSLGVVTGAQQLQELEAAAVHRDQDDGAYTYELDASRLPQLSAGGTRWRDLPGGYGLSRVVDVSTTDPKPSNSGAMFAALMAVAANNGAPLSDDVPRPDVLGTLLTAVSNK